MWLSCDKIMQPSCDQVMWLNHVMSCDKKSHMTQEVKEKKKVGIKNENCTVMTQAPFQVWSHPGLHLVTPVIPEQVIVCFIWTALHLVLLNGALVVLYKSLGPFYPTLIKCLIPEALQLSLVRVLLSALSANRGLRSMTLSSSVIFRTSGSFFNAHFL